MESHYDYPPGSQESNPVSAEEDNDDDHDYLRDVQYESENSIEDDTILTSGTTPAYVASVVPQKPSFSFKYNGTISRPLKAVACKASKHSVGKGKQKKMKEFVLLSDLETANSRIELLNREQVSLKHYCSQLSNDCKAAINTGWKSIESAINSSNILLQKQANMHIKLHKVSFVFVYFNIFIHD